VIIQRQLTLQPIAGEEFYGRHLHRKVVSHVPKKYIKNKQ
jgi:hypothetical protein